MTDSQFLDTISAPSSGKGGRKKAPKRTQDELIEISDESDEQEEEAGNGPGFSTNT